MKFSTHDVDNDLSAFDSCSSDMLHTGWRFNACSEACLTGDEPFWVYAVDGKLKASRMMMKIR